MTETDNREMVRDFLKAGAALFAVAEHMRDEEMRTHFVSVDAALGALDIAAAKVAMEEGLPYLYSQRDLAFWANRWRLIGVIQEALTAPHPGEHLGQCSHIACMIYSL